MNVESLEPTPWEGLPSGMDIKRVEVHRRAVLVVEDDESTRDYLVELLGQWAYQAVPAGSAEEAEVLSARVRPSAAIVDIFLPGKSGTALLNRLRARFPEAVLIGTSALSGAEMARHCKGQGADLFLAKPIEPKDLAKALTSPHLTWH